MTSKPIRSLFGIVIPIITIIALIALLTFSLNKLSKVERDMRIGVISNMLWVVTKTHVSSLKFIDSLNKYNAGEINKAKLELYFDILKSRIVLLNDNPQRGQIELYGFKKDLDNILQNTTLIEHLLDGIETDNKNKTARIQALLIPFNNMLDQAATEAMINDWSSLGDQIDQSRNQVSQIIISLIGISLAGAVLTIHFLLVVRDKKRRVQLLDEEKALSQILIGSSEEAIMAIDMNSNCTVWNQTAIQIFNTEATNAIGQPLASINKFFRNQSVAQAINKSINGNNFVLLDQPLMTNNESKYLDLRCFPLKDGRHQIGVILIATDVTEHRAAQREIAMHRDHLEQVVKTRTKELESALKREQETTDLYRNFGAMISHQFRTPLAVIDSSLQRMIRRGEHLSPEEITERCTKARVAIARLIKLIESTLGAARMDAGQIEVNNQQFDLAKLIKQIYDRSEEWADGRTTNIQVSKTGPVIVFGDITHVEHIILNLLSNAIKYSPLGSVINIDLKGHSNHIECIISNYNETGITLNQEMLFQRYYRDSNAEGSYGIGIGLYMSRVLARMQNGDISLDQSEPNVFKFILTLPRKSDLDHEYIQSLITEENS